MSIAIETTTDKRKRIQRAAKFSNVSLKEFVEDWIMAGVRQCEDDYIINPRTGEIIGDRLEIEELEREVLN